VSSPLFWLRPFDWNSSRFVSIPIFSPCGAALHEIFATPLDRQLLRLHELDAVRQRRGQRPDRFRTLTANMLRPASWPSSTTALTRREADQAGAEVMLAEARTRHGRQVAEEEIDAAKADIAQIDEALQLMLIPKDLTTSARPSLNRAGRRRIAVCRRPVPSVHLLCRAQRWRSRSSANRPANWAATRKWCASTACWTSGRGRVALESGGHRVQRVPATETQAASTPRSYRGRAG
jgi:peptide chain release factor 1